MAKAKTKNKVKISDMLPKELAAEVSRLRTEINKAKVAMPIGREKNTKIVFNARKQLARVLTALNKKAIISK